MGVTSVGPTSNLHQPLPDTLDVAVQSSAPETTRAQGQTAAQLGTVSVKIDLNKLLNLPTAQQNVLSLKQQEICGKTPDKKDGIAQCANSLGLKDPVAVNKTPVAVNPFDGDDNSVKSDEIYNTGITTGTITINGKTNTVGNVHNELTDQNTSVTFTQQTKAGVSETGLSGTLNSDGKVSGSISQSIQVTEGLKISGSVSSSGTVSYGIEAGKDGLVKLNGDNKGGVSADFKLDPNLSLRTSYDGTSGEKTGGIYWSN